MTATVSKLLIATILAILATSASGGGENSEHSAAEDHHEVNIPGVFIFPFACLTIGIIFDVLFSQAMATVFMLAVSFGLTYLGIFCLGTDVMVEFLSRCTWYKLDAYYMMFALLPTLIFESAFSLDAQDFKRFAGKILTLAGPAFILAFVTMGFMMHFMMWLVDDPSWQIWYCMLYGAIVSATDPVAVVALLKALGVPHYLKVLIEGESLFNDGAAIFFHSIFHTVLYREYVDTKFDPRTRRGGIFRLRLLRHCRIDERLGRPVLGRLRNLFERPTSMDERRRLRGQQTDVEIPGLFRQLYHLLDDRNPRRLGHARPGRQLLRLRVAAYVLSMLTRWAAVIIFVVLVVRRFGPCPPEYSPVSYGAAYAAVWHCSWLCNRRKTRLSNSSASSRERRKHNYTTARSSSSASPSCSAIWFKERRPDG